MGLLIWKRVGVSQTQLRDIYSKQILEKAKAILHYPDQHKELFPSGREY